MKIAQIGEDVLRTPAKQVGQSEFEQKALITFTAASVQRGDETSHDADMARGAKRTACDHMLQCCS